MQSDLQITVKVCNYRNWSIVAFKIIFLECISFPSYQLIGSMMTAPFLLIRLLRYVASSCLNSVPNYLAWHFANKKGKKGKLTFVIL